MSDRKHAKVKWFNQQKGYGYIYLAGENDIFFHVTQIQGETLPKNGDKVSFELGWDEKKDKPVALKVNILPSKSKNKTNRHQKPYYGKATYEYHESPGPGWPGAIVGAILAFLLSLWLFGGGWELNSFMAFVGAVVGYAYLHENEVYRGSEITSTCLKCGGTGQVTAREDGYVGFQCPKCKSFWKKRDIYD